MSFWQRGRTVAAYPMLRPMSKRCSTFNRWPREDVKLNFTALAASGFFYRYENNSIQCYYCGSVLRGDKYDDVNEKFPFPVKVSSHTDA